MKLSARYAIWQVLAGDTNCGAIDLIVSTKALPPATTWQRATTLIAPSSFIAGPPARHPDR